MSEPVKTRRLGRYDLDRLISRGGMGEIYLAHVEGAAGFKKPVCIKRILPHLAREPEFVTRFIDEAHIVVNLTHGNIVSVLDMGEVDGEYFIAMEYVAGRDLRDIIKRYEQADRRMPMPLAAWVIGEICKALSYAHKKTDERGQLLHIIHRDVSPSNVLISREGIVKLTDFGIAKAMGKLGKSITGRLQGKFCYMSPEQAAGQSVDHRSDIFSVATVAYELFTGVRPFEEASDLATLESVKRARVEPPSTHREDLPASVDHVLLQALARDREDRQTDAAELGRGLQEAVSGLGVASEAEMAAELSRLFPGEEAAHTTPSRGMPLDAVLAMEAERMLQASPYGESPTLTAPVRPATVREPVLGPVPETTPEPRTTPTPSIEYAYPVVQPRRPWLVVVLLAALLGAGAVALWVAPGLLIETRLTVTCEPEGAEVLVDNVRVGQCDLSLDVDPGTHSVTARMDGYHGDSAEVTVPHGEEAAVHLVLSWDTRIEAKVWVRPGPGGRYRIGNGEWLSSGEGVRIQPGEYEVTVEAPGHATQTVMLTFGPNEPARDVTLEPLATADETASRGEAADATASEEVAEDEATTASTAGEPSEEREAPSRSEHVTLRLEVTPEQARVLVDGEERRTTGSQSLRFDSEDRDHLISVSLEGYEDEEFSFNPRHDRSRTRQITLRPPPVKRVVLIWPIEPGTGVVYVDGDLAGIAPTSIELEVGEYDIRVVNEAAGREETRRVRVIPGEGEQRETFFPRQR